MKNKYESTVVDQIINFIKSDEYNYLFENVKNEWFKTFLEKEKNQIMDAFDSGDHISMCKERLDYDKHDYEYTNAEEYYNYIITKKVDNQA